jgi:Fatty acid hydroxylase
MWAVVYAGGLVGWTLMEYLLHRVLFHYAPVLSQIHARHHHSPQDLIGTPAWASMLIGLVGVAGPSWVVLGFGLGTAAAAGLVSGYLWYVFVHYATHHWRPPGGTRIFTMRACATRATTIYLLAAIFESPPACGMPSLVLRSTGAIRIQARSMATGGYTSIISKMLTKRDCSDSVAPI